MRIPKPQENKKHPPLPESICPNPWKSLSMQSMQSLTSVFLTKAAGEQDIFPNTLFPWTSYGLSRCLRIVTKIRRHFLWKGQLPDFIFMPNYQILFLLCQNTSQKQTKIALKPLVKYETWTWKGCFGKKLLKIDFYGLFKNPWKIDRKFMWDQMIYSTTTYLSCQNKNFKRLFQSNLK